MRHILTSLAVAGGLFCLAGNAAQAQSAPHVYRFCSETTQSMTGWACNFDTWDQCQQYISAERGFCRENPRLETQRSAPERGPGQHSAY
jgi:hypothetical protein